MRIKNILARTFEHFGAEHQRNKLCEEFRELQDELYDIYVKGDDNNNLIDEGIDTIILILQFLFNYGYDIDDILETLDYRITRLDVRLREGYYDKK